MTVERAARDMTALGEQLKKDYPNQYPPDWTLKTRALAEEGRQTIRPALLVLLGAVALVLLIACANIANLLLARAAARARELAIRTALGATRATLVVQMLAESVVLSIAGGALGLLLAYGALRALVALNPSNIPRIEDIRIDTVVLVFTSLVSVGTGLVFGMLPALHAARADVQSGLREGGRSNVGDGGAIVRRGLVVAEIALALVLLVSAGLLIRSFARLQQVNPGFDPRNLVTLNVALPPAKYATAAQQAAFWDARAAAAGVGARRDRCRRDLHHAIQRRRFHRQLHGRGLPAAKGSARPLGRHPHRQPAVPPRHADPPGEGPLPDATRTGTGRARWPWWTMRWSGGTGRTRIRSGSVSRSTTTRLPRRPGSQWLASSSTPRTRAWTRIGACSCTFRTGSVRCPSSR